MPNLDSLLSQTMLFAGVRGAGLEPVPVALSDGIFSSPMPRPQTMEEVEAHERVETAMRNYVWRFRWNPAKPAVFENVTILTRGMGMDYSMEAAVYDEVRFSVQVEREGGNVIDLPLDAAHCIGAWWSRTGEIGMRAAKGSPLWTLPAKLDASLMACFAFQLDGGTIAPLTRAEIDEYGEILVPETGRRAQTLEAGEVESYDVCIGPSRYIVAIELVLCRERPDFVPGSLVGFCRLHPHAFVWSNEDLVRAEASIIMARPAKGMGCDPSMERTISALAVTDTNDEHSSSAWINLPIPYTDNLYDYYETEPHRRFSARAAKIDREEPLRGDHPLQRDGEVTLADARHRAGRTLYGVVHRRTPLVRNKRDVRKTARQGQIDNVHLAARMVATFNDADGGTVTLPGIVMINQCLHDCVHMHVRWSEFLESKMMAGWGPRGPYTVPGAPGVPHNQTVFASFPNKHTLRYRAVAEPCKAGAIQVFCHHGAAYAVDAWPDGQAFLKIGALHASIAAEAALNDEPYRAQLPFGWLEFYWRVRWTGTHGQEPVERLSFNLERCMR